MNLRLCVAVFALCALISGCRRVNAPVPAQQEVVLLCSVDEVYAKPIIRALEQKTGLRVRALFDVEAAKTAGLASRIRAERGRPRSDVFWSSATLQTTLLAREGLLEAYSPPAARDIPARFRDARGSWTATGARLRVIVYHKSVTQPPQSPPGFAVATFQRQSRDFQSAVRHWLRLGFGTGYALE
jgi:iron(III) transport system substrate-binding protein